MIRKRSHSDIDGGEVASTASKRKRIKLSLAGDEEPDYDHSNDTSPESESQNIQATAHRRCTELGDYEAIPENEKRRTLLSVSASTSIKSWLKDLVDSSDFEDPGIMSIPSRLKRPRSASDDTSEHSLASESETDGGVSREGKNSIYRDRRYPALMESKGSFMHDSPDGPLPSEHQLLTKLLDETVPLPADPLFEPQQLRRLCTLLQDRSELRVCIDLHPRLVPSAEILALLHADKFENLVEGHNDRWLDATVFHARLPQPDRTVAYRPSAFTDGERLKLAMVSERTSVSTIRTGMMFPFFTCEVKCGNEALTVADRANTNSMTIALRMVVDLHRQVDNLTAVHRKYLGFSMSHDDSTVRIYGHYPEIDGNSVQYFRRKIRQYDYTDKECEDKWTSYQFFWNVCNTFTIEHLRLIKEAIRRLPDPQPQSIDPQLASNAQSLEILTPTNPTSGAAFSKPGPRQRVTNAALMQKLEQQQQKLEQQQKEYLQQQKEAKEREDRLMTLLEQQQNEAKAQQQEAKAQQQAAKEREDKLTAELHTLHTELLNMLKQK